MDDGDPIALCRAGIIAPNVALARLILAGFSPDAIARLLRGWGEPPIVAMRRLLAARAATVGALAKAAQAVDHSVRGDGALGLLRDGFDRAAQLAPEASVAFYTLGDPDLMAAATAEIIAWLGANGLLRPTWDVLDLGCGIGRVAAALAPHVRSVLGVDVAPEMVRQARARYGHDKRLRFEVSNGRSLPCPGAPHHLSPDAGTVATPRITGEGRETPVAPPSRPAKMRGERGKPESRQHFDLLLAVDSFPYLIQAELADAHIDEAAHRLRDGGAMAILNLSYRGLVQDRADAGRWAARHGFRLACAGAQPFRLWDGRAFLLLKPAG